MEFLTSNIFIAAGAGSFESRRPPVENPDRFLGNGIEYAVRDIKKYENKEIIIFGGGIVHLIGRLNWPRSPKRSI